jgi:anti-sigma regulatory factor (Ser/Thr protein kinase)
VTSTSNVLDLHVPCDENAPRTIRRHLAAVHDGGWSLDDGLLVASELVTNAVQHSGCDENHPLKVEAAFSHGSLVISVTDPGLSGEAAKPTEPTEPRSLYPGGRGLQIIQRLSLKWGAEKRNGYRVWAELAAGSPDG